MKKVIIIAAAVLVGLTASILGVWKYRIGTKLLTVTGNGVTAGPGDTVDLSGMIEVKGRSKSDLSYCIIAGGEYCELGDGGQLRIIGAGGKAMGTVCVGCTVENLAGKTELERLYVDIKDPIGEDNSYEVTADGVSFRVYNSLTDQGGWVFSRGSGEADNDYQVTFHSSGAVTLGELENEIKAYAREKYSMTERDSGYTAGDVALPSGLTARRITFQTVLNEKRYLPVEGESGLVVRVFIYGFEDGGRCFWLEDNNAWCADYELEQIAGTVRP